MDNGIETNLTMMRIYPYTNSRFHRFMRLMMLFFIPASMMLFPVLVVLKLILYSIFYITTLPIAHTKLYLNIWTLKNYLLLPFHHFIYKTSYMYVTIWSNGARISFDGYWFGLDKTKYKDYEHFRSSYRRSVTRRRFRQKLEAYYRQGIIEINIKSRVSFYRILFSYAIFRVVKDSCARKNDKTSLFLPIIREYYLLLLLPTHLRLYKNNNIIVGLSSCLIRGNTLLPCQCLICSDYAKAGIFYKNMRDLLERAFNMPDIRYISGGPTADQSKETSGYYPINFLRTDEFKHVPFSSIE